MWIIQKLNGRVQAMFKDEKSARHFHRLYGGILYYSPDGEVKTRFELENTI